jgi:hypothetical protein
MKKIFLFPVLVLFVLSCQSQSIFGIFAGPQATTAKYSVNGVAQSTSNKYGLQVGVGWKIAFDNHLYFSPAAFYSLKGYKVQLSQYAYPPDTLAIDNNTTIHTFELAFLLQYDFGNQPSHFFAKLGPSLDFQLSGKEKYDLKTGGSVNQSMNYSFTAYGHYAANMIVQLGYETTSGFTIFGQYSLGLTNLSNADAGPTIKHRVYGLSIGKFFKYRKLYPTTIHN